jgi:hypothetical protein
MLSTFIKSIMVVSVHIQRYAVIVKSTVMFSVVIMNVIILSVIVLSVIMHVRLLAHTRVSKS